LVRGEARPAGNGEPNWLGAQRRRGPRGESPLGASAARQRAITSLQPLPIAENYPRITPGANAPPML